MKRIITVCVAILLFATLSVSNLFVAYAASTSGKPNAATRDDLLQPLNNDYLSRTETVYHDVNGKDVTLYGFYRDYNEQGNNPNFSQILMVYQCIKYKDAHPEKDVYITIQSFHFSIALSACVDPTKPDYGHTKNLFDCEYNSDGYVRLSYLLVEAAKKGIEVTVIPQLGAAGTVHNGVVVPDFDCEEYFVPRLSEPAYISGKTVGDYMDYKTCDWTSYGDKSAADMMHNKICTVSNFIDNNGVEHGAAIWTGSINIDGVNELEQNGNNSIQTAVVITEHEKLRRVMYNYARLMVNYCEQEDIVPFRTTVIERTEEQMQKLISGKGDEISEDEQIIYVGSETDSIFELYFTPLGGDFSTWDTVYNPYAKYISKMISAAAGDDYIEFIWNNVKFNQTFEFSDIITEAISYAFEKNANKNSFLHLQLPGIDASRFDKLVAGENVGLKSINQYGYHYHIKDMQLSYVEDEERMYVTILNSLNFHEGSAYHQTNTILVVKESESAGNDFYKSYATLTTPYINWLERHKA